MKPDLALLPLFFALLASHTVSSAEDWPQFRGVNGSGVATGTNPIPSEFSFESKVLWKAKLGDGIGSSVIVDGRVFNTAFVDEKNFVIYYILW